MKRNQYVEDTSIHGRKKEIELKLVRVREMLVQNKLEALLLQMHPNFSWMTAGAKNFVANCFDVGAIALLITMKECFAICNIIEAPRLIHEESFRDLGFEVLVYPWQENLLEEYVNKHVSSLDKVISDVPFGNAIVQNDWIKSLRLNFTDNEIARYLYLGDKLSQAMEEYLITIKAGITEYELAGGISEAIWPYGIEQVMHLVSFDDRAEKYRHALPTSQKLKNNVIVSINGRYKGLIVTTSRMAYIGTPPKSLQKQYIDCAEMECLTISKATVGAREIDLYETLRQAYIDRGYPTMFDKHGQGGCQGYWPREYMITPHNHGIVQENRAYCFNPVIDGTKTEDSFIVTEEGPILITHPVIFPKLKYEFNGFTFERPGMMIID
ncbi:MAG: M24 family metallopeptidase [Christensenellaceae bacterium]|nr:M24 family metallopeptidase [Christensenellaceae bacterium]